MLGSGGKGFADLDAAGASSPATTTGGAYTGPTSQNIDLSNLDLGSGAVRANTDRGDSNNASGGFQDAVDAEGGMTGLSNPMYEFQYTPTPFNPAKMPRCRAENVIMTVVLALNVVLGIASVSTVQLEYKGEKLAMQITAGVVKGCLGAECDLYILPQVFCRRYMSNSAGYLACMILAILLSLIAFVFSICNSCGRAYISKYLVVALATVTWLFFLVSVICLSTLRTSKLCHGTSLGAIGFTYGPAFPLSLTQFLLLSLSILFHFFMRFKAPVQYRYT